jgi:hypothetical protein
MMIESDATLGTTNPTATLNPPCLTAAQVLLLANVTPYQIGANTYKVKPGTLVYNITLGAFQIFNVATKNVSGVPQTYGWLTLSVNSSSVAGMGIGLVSGSPLIIPTGTAVAVEVLENEVPGFLYYNTTSNVLVFRTNAAWVILATVY